MGLVRQAGDTAQVLADFGVDLDQARAAVCRAVEPDDAPANFLRRAIPFAAGVDD